MEFGRIPLDDAEGALLAHAVKLPQGPFRKGRVLSAADITALRDAGIHDVVVARPGADDDGEDWAAARVATAATGAHLVASAAFTGRVNLFATVPGLVLIDVSRLHALNLVNEAVTIATLPAFAVVEPRQMVATIKVIPFAVPRTVVDRCAAEAAAGPPLIRIAPFQSLSCSLVQTRLDGTKSAMLDKTTAVTRNRLAALGCRLDQEFRVAHERDALARVIADVRLTGSDLVLIAGASAITDRRDVVPAAIEQAGGQVRHFGMPVDPGNLLLLADLPVPEPRAARAWIPVLGLPGCARSPTTNGLDWVLERLAAGLTVTSHDICLMGLGGLLSESQSRPLPRAEATPKVPSAPRIAAIVLAAGQSRRMRGPNKLLIDVGGTPMVARVVEAALASQAAPVIVVTGHQQSAVTAALAGRAVTLVHNPAFADGLSTSLGAGVAALPEDIDGVCICLGDMPTVPAVVLSRLIAAYNPVEGRTICVPTFDGQRGNPVLWDRRFFAAMQELRGDSGARHLIDAYRDQVCEVSVDDNQILFDIDTPESYADVLSRH
ncbi:MAG: molybdopterin-binding/glycosyltransferase family 2 protein [Azospirillaceae bacterium]|nr:molybdopterin-binding/glycosyltransferase family 2 protein [Azospirillaceae bacterium]